jgi:hypothetical protein
MTRLAFSAAIREIGQRNADVAASYRDCARRLPPGPVSRLAASMAQQRLELGKVLGSISGSPALPEIEVEFDVSPSHLLGANAFDAESFDGTVIGLGDLLRKMAAAESADHEFLAAAAGAILPLSSALAESLAGEADSARKRSIWAQDHLELLSMM